MRILLTSSVLLQKCCLLETTSAQPNGFFCIKTTREEQTDLSKREKSLVKTANEVGNPTSAVPAPINRPGEIWRRRFGIGYQTTLVTIPSLDILCQREKTEQKFFFDASGVRLKSDSKVASYIKSHIFLGADKHTAVNEIGLIY